MSGGLNWLMKLDGLATRPGDGMHPKFAELMARDHAALPTDVERLPCKVVSSGPAEQQASAAELEAAGIQRIGFGVEEAVFETAEVTAATSE